MEKIKRLEILERDNHVCQFPGCQLGGSNFHLTVAHLPDKHGSNNPDDVRALCTLHHVIEEICRGNKKGAKFLFGTQPILAWDRIFKDNEPDLRVPWGKVVYAAIHYKRTGECIINQILLAEA